MNSAHFDPKTRSMTETPPAPVQIQAQQIVWEAKERQILTPQGVRSPQKGDQAMEQLQVSQK